MNHKTILVVITLVLVILTGCGTTDSLDRIQTYVPYATVFVNEDLTVNGQLVNINDSIVTIIVDGATVEYQMDEINGIKKYTGPDSSLIEKDILKNSNKAASNTGFFVTLTSVGIVASFLMLLVL